MKQRHYRYGKRFMEGGGFYGRARGYAKAYRVARVFRSVVRVSLRDLCQRSENSKALNNHQMHVLLAYQVRRPPRRAPPPPRPRKSIFIETADAAVGVRRAA
jgi:hypothetical protein